MSNDYEKINEMEILRNQFFDNKISLNDFKSSTEALANSYNEFPPLAEHVRNIANEIINNKKVMKKENILALSMTSR